MTLCPHCQHRNPLNTVVCAGCGSLVPAADASISTVCGESAALTPIPVSEQQPLTNNGSQLTRALRKASSLLSNESREERLDLPNPAAVTLPGGARATQGSMATLVGNSSGNYDSGIQTAVGPPPARSEIAAPVAQPRLMVVRGERVNVCYAILEGKNYVGRSADKPVDIDLDGQEAVERIWTSRQHAVITLERGRLSIEDLNSLNGSFVNRVRVHPGHSKILEPGDVLQFGTVQMKVLV